MGMRRPKRVSPRDLARLEREEKRYKHALACENRFIKAHGPVPQDVWNQLDKGLGVASWGERDYPYTPPTYARTTRRGALYLQIPSFPGWVFAVAVDLEGEPCTQ